MDSCEQGCTKESVLMANMKYLAFFWAKNIQSRQGILCLIMEKINVFQNTVKTMNVWRASDLKLWSYSFGIKLKIRAASDKLESNQQGSTGGPEYRGCAIFLFFPWGRPSVFHLFCWNFDGAPLFLYFGPRGQTISCSPCGRHYDAATESATQTHHVTLQCTVDKGNLSTGIFLSINGVSTWSVQAAAADGMQKFKSKEM